jgi:hypothetical protein
MQIPVGEGPYALLKTVALMIAPQLGSQIGKRPKREIAFISAGKKLPPVSAKGEAESIPPQRKIS